jgi:ATP-dependent Lon protease
VTRRKVKSRIAMSGEITLRGKVLPVGGIKEKILAAKRASVKTIILCDDNKKDVDEINQNYLRGLQFQYVSSMIDVIDLALTSQKATKQFRKIK